MTNTVAMTKKPRPSFRKPRADDGAAVWQLIRDCKPLDENSMYCNLLQSDHFSDTCILAELEGEVVGWVSAYVLPKEPDALFVWQVAVSEKARGMGLAVRLINLLLKREECAEVTRLQTTITSDNGASWALFRKFAEKRGGTLELQPHFTEGQHFDEKHATEYMVTITFGAALEKVA